MPNVHVPGPDVNLPEPWARRLLTAAIVADVGIITITNPALGEAIIAMAAVAAILWPRDAK